MTAARHEGSSHLRELANARSRGSRSSEDLEDPGRVRARAGGRSAGAQSGGGESEGEGEGRSGGEDGSAH